MSDNNPTEIIQYLSVNPDAEHGLILQIKKQVTWLIASQKLIEGDLLPSVRSLANYLDVNMHTVRLAYSRLEAEGLIATRPRTRARVLAYDPVNFANMAGKIRNHTVGLILPTMSNPFYQTFLKGVQSIADQNNTLNFICNTHDDEALAWRYYAQLISSGVDGVITVSHDMSDIIRSEADSLEFPLVSADFPLDHGYAVELDHEQSGFLATEHLARHGRRRIALVRYAVDVPAVLQIQQGYETALKQTGLPVSEDYIIPVNSYDRESGKAAAHHLLAMPEPPEAVFFIADQLAIGAMLAFQEAGVNIPQDIAITSFNNIPEAAFITPSLTSVDSPTEQLGKTSMLLLNELIAGRTPQKKHVCLSCPELIIRQSCGCTRS